MNKMLTKLSIKNIGWEPYVYLVYLAFLFFQPSFDPERSWLDIVIVLGLTAIFLPIYFATYLDRGNRLKYYIGAMTFLGVLGMYLNSGSSVFFVYAAAASAYLSRPKKAVRAIIIIALVAFISAIFSPIPMPWRIWAYGPAVIFTILIGFLGVFQQEKLRANTKLSLAQEEIEQLATVAERERIARDLHDLLGHTLSIITLKSELAGKLIDTDNQKAKQEIKDIEEISRKTLKEVRLAISGYRSRGLEAEIANTKLILASANIDFDAEVDLTLLSPLQEASLSLILREAVTNIVRHSKADKVKLVILEKTKNIVFEISDNGVGLHSKEGNGLKGIRERIEALGGQLEIESLKGLKLTIFLAIESQKLLAKKDVTNS